MQNMPNIFGICLMQTTASYVIVQNMKTGKVRSNNTYNQETAADHTECIDPEEADFDKGENRGNLRSDGSSRMVKPSPWYFTHS
jgi:hypothetical protein